MSASRVTISRLEGSVVQDGPIEVVERKGLGHPDTICDALAEEFSIALSRFYRERFGFVLHHNVDKLLLRGGAALPAYGGGEVVEPIELYLAGRATREYKGVKVPVEDLAEEACGHWLRAQMHALDPERHVRLHCLVRPGSAELVELFERQERSGIRLANDTSCGVGYAPHTDLEKVVLAVEQQLNAPDVKASRPEIGEDVKVMGVRQADRLDLTVACAFVGRYVRDLEDYLSKRERVRDLAGEVGRSLTGRDVTAVVNAGDAPSSGDVYLTVTGTSAEAGDDGETGRGNRANGLITPYRPMTLEAVAGKNPITHVGKLYNVVARSMAEDIVEQIAPVQSAQVYLVSQIGKPIDEPQVADVKIATAEHEPLADLSRRVEEIVHTQLAGLDTLWESLLARATRLY